MVLKTLLISNSEYGQFNTILAIATELTKREGCEIHVASFSDAEPRVQQLAKDSGVPISFHAYPGPSYKDAGIRIGLADELVHEPTSKTFRAYQMFDKLAAIFTHDEYLQQMNETRTLILKLDPDVIVVDFIFGAVFDACIALNRRCIVSAPIQALDISRMRQPRLRWLWYYPA